MNAILPRDRADWLALRQGYIGGSEIASLFYIWQINDILAYLHMFERPPVDAVCLGCVSRHTTGFRLYHQKIGTLPADDLFDERIAAGVFGESGIADWAQSTEYAPHWGMRLEKARSYTPHPTVRGMGASRDYQEVAPGFPPVEVKNVDGLIFRDLWKVEGGEIVAPPMDITLQLQVQIACGSARGGKSPYGWVIACVGGNKLLRGRIDRHEPTIAKIEQAVTAFWAAIDAGTPPLDIADFDTVADLSLLGAEERAAPLDLTGDSRADDLCARFKKIDGIVKRGEAARDRVKAQLALKLGDAPNTIRASTAKHKITWPLVHRGEKTHRGGFTVREI